MAKRRKRGNKPDLPEATLARARAQARGEDPDAVDEEDAANGDPEESPSEPDRTERRSRRRAAPQPVQFARRRGDDKHLDSSAIQNALANPTKSVSAEQLQEEYGYVVSDIRNMFMLAGVLLVVLVALAQFI